MFQKINANSRSWLPILGPTCWPKEALQAQGLVAKVRDLVNVKDGADAKPRHRLLAAFAELASPSDRRPPPRTSMLPLS